LLLVIFHAFLNGKRIVKPRINFAVTLNSAVEAHLCAKV
jgi:hypothetical protein